MYLKNWIPDWLYGCVNFFQWPVKVLHQKNPIGPKSISSIYRNAKINTSRTADRTTVTVRIAVANLSIDFFFLKL